MDTRVFPYARQAVEYLEGGIAQRRVQERRQKFQDDLQLIRDRKNQKVIIPVAAGHDQEMWFEKLDSHGIWERIFPFLTDPSDVTSAYFACDMFMKHLEEQRKTMLLPKVFAVLRDTAIWRDSYTPDGNFKMIKPSNENRDFLNLRLVSKLWKKAADEHFIEAPLGFSQSDWHLKCDENNKPFVMSSFYATQRQFTSVGSSSIDRAIEALGTTPSSSSSLLRTISVYDKDIDQIDIESFYSKLWKFLDIHGPSVWGLLFYHDDDFDYSILCNLVSRLPNLKAMDIRYCRPENYHFNIDFAKARLRRQIGETPFPRVPSLELCKFYCFSQPGNLLFVEILQRNADSIKTLFLDFWDQNQDQDYDDYQITDSVWNALSKLRLEHFNLTLREDFDEENYLDGRILRMREFDWPLKVLHLYYDYEEYYDVYVNYGTFFELLNRFSDTLVEASATNDSRSQFIALLVHGWCSKDEVVTRVDGFPNLKQIQVSLLPCD